MDSEGIVSSDYVRGFNEGYILGKHNPELASKPNPALASIQTDRANGFKSGLAEYNSEMNREKYPAWLKKDRLNYVGCH